MEMSFENLYMSQSMHELFNKKSASSPEEAAALAIFGSPARRGRFTLDAMIAANDSYSVNAEDLNQYPTQH